MLACLRSLLLLAAAFELAVEPCPGQETATQATATSQPSRPRLGKAVRSPEVAADGSITFRFHGPNAKEVVLAREGAKPALMTKDDAGTWQITTEPLPPDFYDYEFYVDGVAVGDAGNSLSKPIITGGHKSIAHVPGPDSLCWERNDVPSGIVHRHVHKSRVLDGQHEFFVYTPPGYDPTDKRDYPVLYLLHGVKEGASAWTSAGRAEVILDNLIARKEAEPMLLVMPLGYGFANPADRVGELFMLGVNHQRLMDVFARVLFEEVIPQVERGYRVKAEREARAIAGVSMGGTQALYIGLNHPQRFGRIGSFSGALIMLGGRFDAFFPSLAARAESKSLWIGCGTEDFLLGSNRVFQNWLKSKGVPFDAVETPGGHTWNVWRRNLAQFAGSLFRDAP